MPTTKSPAWAEHPELVEFYSGHRNRPEDLYPSERRFLPWLAKQTTSLLDVGCAAGGFYAIWNHYQPGIRYTGVDVSRSLIAAARSLYPQAEFEAGNCVAGLPLPNRHAQVVQALGWLHWEPGYKLALCELWRLCDRYLFFDVRLVAEEQQAVDGRQQMAFTNAWDGVTTTPYLCVEWSNFATLLTSLQPRKILGYGYWGTPSETAIDVPAQVCFATFVLEKAQRNDDALRPLVGLEMPLDWPRALSSRAELLTTRQMEDLMRF